MMLPMTMAMMNKMTSKMTVMNMTMAVTKKMTTKIAMTMASKRRVRR